jgi:pyrroloquinoline quinone biosynthesis protein E
MERAIEPTNLTFNLTYRCRYRCVFCEVHPVRGFLERRASARELEEEEVERIIDQAAGAGVRSVSFTGGEPFARGDIFGLIDFCAGSGITLGINTRHTFTSADVGRLPPPGRLFFWVSLDAHCRELAERLARRRGFFEPYLSGVRRLVDAGHRVACSVVVNRGNVRRLGDLFGLIHDLGITEVHSREMTLTPACVDEYPRPGLEEASTLLLTAQDRELARAQEDTWRGRLRFGETVGSRLTAAPRGEARPAPRCNTPKGIINVRPDGKVVYCNLAHDLTIGDLRAQSFDEFLASSTLRQMVRPTRELFEGTRCQACHAFEECTIIGRCYKLNRQLHGRLFVEDFKLCGRYLGAEVGEVLAARVRQERHAS